MNAKRALLDCGFPQVAEVLEDCMVEAQAVLSPEGLTAYLESGRFLSKMGRGVEPVLIFLQEWPQVAAILGETALASIMDATRVLNKSPNGRAIAPFFQSLASVARRLPTQAQMQLYLDLALHTMERTSSSIHGIHKTYPSPSLIDFFEHAPHLLTMLTIEGLRNWTEYGIHNYKNHPDQQRDFFRLRSPDSKAMLQRERHGTLLVDNIRKLDLYLLALWEDADYLVPYSTLPDATNPGAPYFDSQGIRLPDVYDDDNKVSGIDRYRAALAHMAAHRRWSTPIFADNFSPAQRLTIETFEDARVDLLAIQQYPGLRELLLALHPVPALDACNPATHSCLRHRLTMLSRAVLDPHHNYQNAELLTFAGRVQAAVAVGTSDTTVIANLALSYLAKTRLQSDQLATTFFQDTQVSYRDDNRHLWQFHELSDDEEQFDNTPRTTASDEATELPPRHYHEWDYTSQWYRPDWVSLYERLHHKGDPATIDRILDKHSDTAKRLKRLLDLLKPQDKVRIRYQEDGAELDLDIALRSLIDWKSGCDHDPRINMSHRTNGRDIAVTVLLDLSQSLNDKAPKSNQSILELSREAVSLLGWAIDILGDPLAIAGFHSNTRHDVRYSHFKGFTEPWGDDVKGRLAAMDAGFSTRMGAAMRHAAHTLSQQKSDKKLLLVLTDGQPSDVDVHDSRHLIEDARQSVKELRQDGIFTYCINLDANADAYVSDIFGKQYTVIDNIDQLPEKLPQLFLALTA